MSDDKAGQVQSELSAEAGSETLRTPQNVPSQTVSWPDDLDNLDNVDNNDNAENYENVDNYDTVGNVGNVDNDINVDN